MFTFQSVKAFRDVKFDNSNGLECMGTPMTLGVINTLAGMGNTYLEIGVYRGASLVAAAHGNPHCKCIGLDNFSQFDSSGTNEATARKRIEPYSNAEIINIDCWKYIDQLGNTQPFIDTYFYDGAHDYDSQWDGLTKIYPYLKEGAYIIVDDTNRKPVKWANFRFVDEYEDIKLRANFPAPELDTRHPVWWNGIQVMQKL